VLGPREPLLDDILRSSLLEDRMPTIQVDDNAGRILELLTALRRPRHAVEIGTLFGYSAIHLARGLPPDGRLTTLEIDPHAAAVARRNLATAGLADRVDVVVGDAAEHLRTIPPGTVGLVFIDGDKRSYPDHLKLAFPLLEPGGLLIADDAYAVGDYTAEAVPGADAGAEARAIQTYARAVGRSPLLRSAFLGGENGLLVGARRG
jgi:predicted O-methyltransferase YrrM